MLALSARIQTLLRGHKYKGWTLFGGCALAGEEILFIAEGFGESPEGFGFLWSCFLKD